MKNSVKWIACAALAALLLACSLGPQPQAQASSRAARAAQAIHFTLFFIPRPLSR